MSKHKVMRVITSCSECEHRKELEEIGGNSFYSAVCAFSYDKEEDNETKPFMLFFNTQHPKHYEISIPDNCPLPDYKQ